MAVTLGVAAATAACRSDDDTTGSTGIASTASTDTASTGTAGTVTDTDTGTADPLPLLPAGTPLGVSSFSPTPPELAAERDDLWDRVQAVSPIGRVMVDWVDVEPEEGVYETGDIVEGLTELRERGQAPMLSIVATDVSGTPFPSWLGDTFEPARAAAAYNRMLDALAPIIRDHDVWYLAVANEPPLEELDRMDFAEFVAAVRDHARPLLPDTAVGFVFAGGDALADDAAGEALRNASDVLALNHYCLDAGFQVTPIEELDAGFDRILDAADGRPVVFQELGCPASAELGSSDEFQADWMEAAFDRIAAEPDVRAAYVFEFVDWSDDLVGFAYDELLAAPEERAVLALLADWLGTSGLVRQDLTTRPVFDVYLDAAAASSS
ncbi:MAG: hypothetical protein AAGG08_01710 [Actinomycetota bacterium]